MEIDINSIVSGPTRALLYFDFTFEALYEDRVSSVDRQKFYYFIRSPESAHDQRLPREPHKQYQILLQLQDNNGFKVEPGLINLKPGSKIQITILDKSLFINKYNQSIHARNLILKSLDPVVKDARNREFFDYIENAGKQTDRLLVYFGKNPRAIYKTKEAKLTTGSKRYAILEHLSNVKNHPEDVRIFKNLVNDRITNGHQVRGFADAEDAIRNLKASLGLKANDYFPIITDGYKQMFTWLEK